MHFTRKNDMSFKGFKKEDQKASSNHFEKVEKQIGRPLILDYQKQDKRIQFYISQEVIDILTPIAFKNGCKDITAYAKKLLLEEVKKV